MSGVEKIRAERHRQILVEGWTPAHDDEHGFFEMAQAAKTYISAAQLVGRGEPSSSLNVAGINTHWPWALDWWKPSEDPIRNLVKAGALIAAEIDRLERARSGS